MRRDNRNKNKKRNILVMCGIIIALVIILPTIFLNIVEKDKNKGKIQIIINNNNVTSKLKNAAYINQKDVVYMSITDIKNYLDNYIYNDKENNQIITTYGEKIGVLSTTQNTININNTKLNILSGIETKNDEVYIPISLMSNVYNMEMTIIKDKKVLTMDSLDRELIKMDASKNLKVRNKKTFFSRPVDKIKKGEKVIVIEEKDGWSKIRTTKGKIGYVKTSGLQNKVYVRNKLEKEKQITGKVNMVWDYFSEYAKVPNRNGTTIEGVNVVSPTFFHLVKNGDGKISTNIGTNGTNYISWAKQNNYKVWGMFSNNSYKDTTSKILNSYTLRTNLINSIVNLANTYNLDGINIDFENMSKSDKEMFSRFIIELKPKLQEAGKVLSVDVTAMDGGDDWSECYDRNAIGNVADYVVFMAYDQYTSNSSKAGTTAGYNWIETNIKKFIDREEVKSEKIILAMPLYTRLWQEKNGKLSSKTVSMKEIDNTIPSDVQKTWNDDLKQYYVEYEKKGITYKMWIEDEASFKAKLGLVKTYNLAGVATWEKDREKEGIWSVIKEELNN